MAHIVIDARIINSSTGSYQLNLLENLQDVDKKNRYSVLVPPKDLEYWKPKSKRFTLVPTLARLGSASEQVDLTKQIRKLKPDLVHFTMPQQPAILGRIKRVTTVMDLTPLYFKTPKGTKTKRKVFKLLLKWIGYRSSAIITISEYTKDQFAKLARINSRKITVTYCAADKIQETPEPIEELADKEFILFVGRPSPHKNLEGLVDAFEIIRQAKPDVRLVLAGKTTRGYKKLEKYVQSKSLNNVVFTDFVSSAQLRWLYENATVYAFPSLSEGFGLPGLEAMLHGCPVVSSNATCLPEVYEDAALYFTPTNVEEMSEQILKVISDSTLRSKLKAAGTKQAAKYSWKKMAEQTLEIYTRVLEQNQ